MSEFRKQLDATVRETLETRAHNQRVAKRRAIEAAELTRRQAAVEQRREQSANTRIWNPLISRMGEMAADAADCLIDYGVRPSSTVHRITRRRESSYFLSGKIFTQPIPAWIINQSSQTFSDGDGWQSTSWTITSGSALGKNGKLYRFSDEQKYLTKGRFCTDGPVTDADISGRYRVSALFECFNYSPGIPLSDSLRPDAPEMEATLEAWKEVLGRFVLSKLTPPTPGGPATY